MIQALFAGIFLITFLPVAYTLCKDAVKAEARIGSMGLASRLLIAAAIVAFTLVQRNWLGDGSGIAAVKLIHTACMLFLIAIPMHEFGHFLFMPLGQTMFIFGGSFFEMLLPACMVAWFLYKRCPTLSCVALFLLGHNIIHVSQYMATARHHEGMLFLSLDQSPETHDWFRLFRQWNLLEQDTQIAAITSYAGSAIILLSLVFLFIMPRLDDSNFELEQGAK